jgi:hypothetical protein
MPAKSVFGLVHDEAHACRVVEKLQSAGFAAADISVLLPDRSGTHDFAYAKGTKAPEGALAGAGAGGVLGGALGLLAAFGALAIPGVGAFIAAGPLLSTLSGVAVGATAGGFIGALIGMGVPEYLARVYEGKLREGRVLFAVHCRNSEEVKLARKTLERAEAVEISVSGRTEASEDLPTDRTAVKRRSARF